MATYKRWETYEIDFLLKTYHTTAIKHIAKELDRPEKSVFIKAHRLRLKNKRTHAREIKKEHLARLINSGIYDVNELSKSTGLSIDICNKEIGKANALRTKPKQMIPDYILTEDDILDSIEMFYRAEDLKGWELNYLNKTIKY